MILPLLFLMCIQSSFEMVLRFLKCSLYGGDYSAFSYGIWYLDVSDYFNIS